MPIIDPPTKTESGGWGIALPARSLLGMGSILTVALSLTLPPATAMQEKKKGPDDDRIPATKLPVAEAKHPAVAVDAKFWADNFGLKGTTKLVTVSSKNVVLHYAEPTTNAEAVRMSNLKYLESVEARLAFTAKVLFDEKEVSFRPPLHMRLPVSNVEIPEIGVRRAAYFRILDPKTSKIAARAVVIRNDEEDTPESRQQIEDDHSHELPHAVLGEYLGDVPIWADEGIAVSFEKNGFTKSKAVYLELKNTKAFERCATADRIMRDTGDHGKSNNEVRAAYAARCLLVMELIELGGGGEKGLFAVGTFMKQLKEREVATQPLSNENKGKYEEAFGKAFPGKTLTDLGKGFDSFLQSLKKD